MKIRISLRSIPHNELRLSRKSFRKNAKPQNYLGTWLMNVPSNFKHTRHQKSWVFDKLLSQPFPKLINFIELLLRFNRFVIWAVSQIFSKSSFYLLLFAWNSSLFLVFSVWTLDSKIYIKSLQRTEKGKRMSEETKEFAFIIRSSTSNIYRDRGWELKREKYVKKNSSLDIKFNQKRVNS